MTVVLAAAIVGTAAVGFAGAVTTGLIYACVNNSSGTIKVVSATTACATNEILLVWNGEGEQGPAGPTGPTGPTGPAGPSGTFSGTFTSPSGMCSIQVTDGGIVFGTQSCPLTIDVSTLHIRSSTTTTLLSGSTTTVQSSANTSISSGGGTTVSSGGNTSVLSGVGTIISGNTVTLGGTSGCSPVARIGDLVTETGTIITGSTRVTAC